MESYWYMWSVDVLPFQRLYLHTINSCEGVLSIEVCVCVYVYEYHVYKLCGYHICVCGCGMCVHSSCVHVSHWLCIYMSHHPPSLPPSLPPLLPIVNCLCSWWDWTRRATIGELSPLTNWHTHTHTHTHTSSNWTDTVVFLVNNSHIHVCLTHTCTQTYSNYSFFFDNNNNYLDADPTCIDWDVRRPDRWSRSHWTLHFLHGMLLWFQLS